MKRIYLIGLMATLIMALGTSVCAQTDPNKLTVAFSDPSRPGLLKVQLLQGSITVRAGSARDVIITTTDRARGNRNNNRRDSAENQGLRRLDNSASGLTVDESNNTMVISTGSWSESVNLDIQVPARTNLQLKSINGGNIIVEGVDGDMDVHNDNGDVTLTDVSGSAIAHSLNGDVRASMKRLTAQKAMSFTSLNGRVDVTLPADLKANVKMRSDNGEIWTDYDVQVKTNPAPATIDNRTRGGRLRIEVDRSIFGTINGGGPDFTFQTLNGNIYIRKVK